MSTIWGISQPKLRTSNINKTLVELNLAVPGLYSSNKISQK